MPLVIGFVGRFATQEGVRPPLVVPFQEASEPSPEIPAAKWDVKQTCAFVLQRTNESFNHGNASVLADGTEAGLDLFAFAPALKPIAPELASLVGDDVLGLGTVLLDRAIQKLLNCPGSRLLSEDHEPHGTA
jgi:hypothetical protein